MRAVVAWRLLAAGVWAATAGALSVAEQAAAPWAEVTWGSLPGALRRGPAYVVYHSPGSWGRRQQYLEPRLSLARRRLRGFVQLLGLDVEAEGLNHTLAEHLYDAELMPPGDVLRVVFVSGLAAQRPFLFEGPLEAEHLAAFAVLQLHPEVLYLSMPAELEALRRLSVPTCVLCLPADPHEPPAQQGSSLEALVSDFEASASQLHYAGRSWESAHVFEAPRQAIFAVLNGSASPTSAPRCSSPSLEFWAEGYERVLDGDAFWKEYSWEDWIQESLSSALPELTWDNKASLAGEATHIVLVMFNHRLLERRRAVMAAVAPLVYEYGIGRNARFVTHDAGKYGQRFGLRKDQEALIVTEGGAPPEAKDVFVGFASNSSVLGAARRRLEGLVNMGLEALSDHLVVLPEIISDEEAATIRSVLPDGLVNLEEDSVDGHPTFDADLPCLDVPNCSKVREAFPNVSPEACVLEGRVASRVRPMVKRAAQDWDLEREGQEMRLCASFVRRYKRRERRRIANHFDKSVVTVIVLLNDPADFQGGLVVFPPDLGGEPVYPERTPRSAVMHRGQIRHGIQLRRGFRYSWIQFWHYKCGEVEVVTASDLAGEEEEEEEENEDESGDEGEPWAAEA